MEITSAQDPPVPAFDLALCSGSGRCVAVCPVQALVLVNHRPKLRPGVPCTYCGTCEDACPTGAISLSYEIVLGAA